MSREKQDVFGHAPLRRSRSGNPDTIINFGNNDSYNHVTATTANYGSSNRSRDKLLLMISITKISVLMINLIAILTLIMMMVQIL